MKPVLLVCGAILSISTACGSSSTEPKSVAAVSITPSSVNVIGGSFETKQLTATITAAGGSVLSGRDVVWTTSDKKIATVSAEGIVKGILPGTATITATSEGKSGTAEINVLPMTDSLTGTWVSSFFGPLTNLQLQLTETNADSVTGQWTGYVAGCTPLNGAQCQRSGVITRGYRHGSSAQFIMAPASPCGIADATVIAMFARFDSLAVLVTQHNCNAADGDPSTASLTRQK
jgi:hypothetical protein